MNDGDKYVTSHIYAMENEAVNALFAEYERAYHNMAIALEAVQQRYGSGETWNASDAQFRQRTETLLQQIVQEMQALTNRTGDITMQAAMNSYYASYYGRAWITDMVSPNPVNIPLIPVEAVRAAIMKPYEGNTFVDRFKGRNEEFATRIRKSIVQSQINGETMYQAQKRIANELGLAIDRRTQAAKQAHKADFNRTQMIARTEIIRTSSLGSLAVYENNKDVLKGWTWQASRDDRVCDECADEDGQDHLFSEHYSPPPKHPNCRCTSTPYFGERDLDAIVQGDIPSFKEWAANKGIDQSRYGNVYNLKSALPPKKSAPEKQKIVKTVADKEPKQKTEKKAPPAPKPVMSPPPVTSSAVDDLPDPVPLTSAGAKAMMMASPDKYNDPSQKWSSELTKPEKKSLLDYMRGDYMAIKAKIEQGIMDAQIKNLLSAIEKAPPVNDITYRGEDGGKLSQEQLEDKWKRAVGTVVEQDNILSVSLNPEVASKFRGKSAVMFQIMSNRGKYVNGVTARTGDDDEFEAILPPGSKFKVIGTEQKQIMTRTGLKDVFLVKVEDVTYGH